MISSCHFFIGLILFRRLRHRWRYYLSYAQRRSPMYVLDMLNVTRGAARRVEPGNVCRPFKKLRIMTLRASCARIAAIDFSAQVACLVTTRARQYLIACVQVLNAADSGNYPNPMHMNRVELCISPLLSVALIG